jgi:FlaA1/EpsC-like NDP-sugar epimerase
MKPRVLQLVDLPLLLLAVVSAFGTRFGADFFGASHGLLIYGVAALIIKPLIFTLMGMYSRYWPYAGLQDLAAVAKAVAASFAAMVLLVFLASIVSVLPAGFSPVVVVADGVCTLLLVGGARLGLRLVHEARMPRPTAAGGTVRRVLIVGAGAAGTMVAHEIRRNPQLGIEPVGFLDDDAEKLGKHLGGLLVLGPTRALPEMVRAHRVDSVVIAMPSARGSIVRTILELCNAAGVRSQAFPGVFELLDGKVSVNRLRNVEISDLLRRSPVDGQANVAGFVTGRAVLITGGGGSIGSELARQIANAGPSHLIILGHGENSIFEAAARLGAAFPNVRLTTVIADIRDDERLGKVFDTLKPEIVFHAAAHKHVPLMEANPEEAVTNNVVGTRNVVRQAVRVGTERFVLISTDKAVAPTSLMGATKRIAELIVRRAARDSGRAFVCVRFGNVLGSRGSVVHTFKRQIEAGGPITVSHPDMTRFFMTIPEAVHLVLQASGQGHGGDLFMLDMGEPVKIVQLARDLIKLSGLTENDIPIVFSGVRPGEKLVEVLFDEGMETRRTAHPDVLQVMGDDIATVNDLDGIIARLATAARGGDREVIDALLRRAIPGFTPDRPATAPPA